jgi:phosphohistidine phosphatase SixA
MPTRLIIMRHATSGWKSPQQADHDRTLTEEGRLETPKMSQALIDLDWVPDYSFVSSSTRTLETHSLLMDLPSESRPEIYRANLNTLMLIIEQIQDGATTLILGHNPGCEMLVANLSGEFHSMPPATCALFTQGENGWILETVLRTSELN